MECPNCKAEITAYDMRVSPPMSKDQAGNFVEVEFECDNCDESFFARLTPIDFIKQS
jgi:hypothetical protein